MSRLLKKVRLYYSTVRYLKFKQVFYQIYYRIKNLFPRKIQTTCQSVISTGKLELQASIPSCKSYLGGNIFVFLNQTTEFQEDIDWNFTRYGKLWTYNLNYFDFLLQKGLLETDALRMLDSYERSQQSLKDGLEPYPISLRGINLIKYFSYQKISNSKYDLMLRRHYDVLAGNLEFHLMGNHLLENAFSMLFAAYYFTDDRYRRIAVKILKEELQEQVLEDGAHFELSPMYHQILLLRLLDCINLVGNNPWNNNNDLLALLNEKAGKMLGWLRNVTFSTGDVPMVNDCAFGIAPSSTQLNEYAERLGVPVVQCDLNDSGYRRITRKDFELLIDVGNIGPDYIPGHAHSDTFSFVLYHNGRPVIVDTGTSTYESNIVRITERSTLAHNTVIIHGIDQSEIWSSFRVGRRAKIDLLSEGHNCISASHNGYRFIGATHQRSWRWSEREIIITDSVKTKKELNSIASFHFHPDVVVSENNGLIDANGIQIRFKGHSDFYFEDYDFAAGFNNRIRASVLRVSFKSDLESSLTFPI